MCTSCLGRGSSDCDFGKYLAITGISAATKTPCYRTAVVTANFLELRGRSALGHKKLPYMELALPKDLTSAMAIDRLRAG
jgi:hypothetical protein